MATEHGQSDFCPVFHKSVELIGRRWTGAIIRAMRNDRCRFSDIAHAIPGLSDRLLSERLKELEFESIVTRTVIPETPVKIEYHLTEKGRDLDQVMEAISNWAGRWTTDGGHSTCDLPPLDSLIGQDETESEAKAIRSMAPSST